MPLIRQKVRCNGTGMVLFFTSSPPVPILDINLECESGYFLHKGRCLLECPEQFYPSFLDIKEHQDFNNNLVMSSTCLACHYTCRYCSGSNDYQCTSCYPDASLITLSNIESYCYPNSLLDNIQSEKWYFRVYVLLWIVLLVFIITVSLYIIRERNLRRLQNEVIQFNTLRNIRQLERNIKSTVYSDSD